MTLTIVLEQKENKDWLLRNYFKDKIKKLLDISFCDKHACMVVDHTIQSGTLDRHSFQLKVKFQID